MLSVMYTEVSCGISAGGHLILPLPNWLCLSGYIPGMVLSK